MNISIFLMIVFQIIAIWIVPIIVVLPPLTGIWGQIGLECNSRICTILKDDNGNNPKHYLKLLAVYGPGLVLIAADVSIFLKMRVIVTYFLHAFPYTYVYIILYIFSANLGILRNMLRTTTNMKFSLPNNAIPAEFMADLRI